MELFVVHPHWAVTTRWLCELSLRLVYQWASFNGEHRVHAVDAEAEGVRDLVPDKAGGKLMKTWQLRRLAAEEYAKDILSGADGDLAAKKGSGRPPDELCGCCCRSGWPKVESL